MIKCVIFDFDLTLFDSSNISGEMNNGNWGEVFKNSNYCQFYAGAKGVIQKLKDLHVKVAIATNSPRKYVNKVLTDNGVDVDYLVAYHDVNNHKPEPDCIHLILEHFKLDSSEVIYIGDNDTDVKTAINADIRFYGVDWGVFDGKPTTINYKNFFDTVSGAEYNYFSVLQREENRYYLGFYNGEVRGKVLDFKNNNIHSVIEWGNVFEQEISILPPIDYIVRALGHNELNAVEGSLDGLCERISTCLQAEYLPKLLIKDKETEKSVKLNRRQRFKEINGVYNVAPQATDKIPPNSSILIVDDVYTTGATTNDICRALHHYFPSVNVYIFTLVKTLISEMTDEKLFHNRYLLSQLSLVSKSKGRKQNRQIAHRINKEYSANYSYTNHNFIIQNLSSGSVRSEEKRSKYLPAIYLLKNILQRGKPTLLSRYLRGVLGDIHSYSDFLKPIALIDRGHLNWERLIRGGNLDQDNPAKYFYEELLDKYLDDFSFVKNLILPEVKIFDITRVYEKSLSEQQVDFYLPQASVIIEIDGMQHLEQKESDEYRDAHTRKYGIETIRFTTSEIYSQNKEFLIKMKALKSRIQSVLTESEYGESSNELISLANYRESYLNGVDVQNKFVIATAIIRIQLLILELLENGELTIGEHWSFEILFHESIDFVEDAIEDIFIWLENLLSLQGIPFVKSKYKVRYLGNADEFSSSSEIVKIDFSILKRYSDSFQSNPSIIYIRNHYLDTYNYFDDRSSSNIKTAYIKDYDFFELSSTEAIKYSLNLDEDSLHRKNLLFFLENIFLPYEKEVKFREGQIGIIASSLTGNDTIGLLPTGSGKSVCYQLSAILQPSISFVVCPIKSLMYDQKIDLDSILLTRTNYISSDQHSSEKALIQAEFSQGKYFFIFISPKFISKSIRKLYPLIRKINTTSTSVTALY